MATEEMRNCEQVLPALEAAPKARSFEFSKAMQVCGESRDFRSLLQVWKLCRDRKVPLSRPAYSRLIDSFAKCTGRQRPEMRRLGLEAGKRAWQWMLHDGQKPDAIAVKAALHLCAAAGDVTWATQLWDAAPEPDTAAWNRYLETLARHPVEHEWEIVERELSKTATGESAISPNSVTLCMLIDAAAEQHDVQRAQRIWQDLTPRVELNAVVYAARSKSLLLGSRHDLVPDLREDMQKQNITPTFRNILHEVQARLLLLHEQPETSRFEGLPSRF